MKTAKSSSKNNFTHGASGIMDYRELVPLIIAFFCVLLLGVLGFSYIEGWNLFDSLYMTVITLTTVGFQEVHPLSNSGRAFAIILIFFGFGLVTVFFSSLTQFFMSRQILWALKGRNMQDFIDKLENHTIICGYGRLAKIAALEVRKNGVDVVIIDSDEIIAEEAKEDGFLVVVGDATLDEILIEAGIKRAKRLVSLLPKGSDNLYVVLTSRELCPNLFILSRAEDEAFEKRLMRAGVTRLISPYRVGGQKIADGLIRPYVTNFLDLAASSNKANLQIEEIKIPERSPLIGRSLGEANFRQVSNIIVAAIIPRMGEMVFNPSAQALIDGGSTFIVLGEKEELHKFEKILLSGSVE
jgi:voltage-gated potassium channel